MSFRLIACPSCSNYVKSSEPYCIACGKKLRDGGVVGRTAGAVLMGLSLSACPADDTTGDSMAGSESQTSTGTDTSTSTLSASTTDPSTGTTEATDPGSDSTTFAGESAYGVPGTTGTTIETETSAETDTDTDTGGETMTGTTATESESTAVSPDYGVPDTSP